MLDRIAERLREMPSTHLGVIPQSLPVVSFGNFMAPQVRVATIALNPSSKEFWSGTGKWLSPAKSRLASRHSLGLTAGEPLTDAHLEQVLAASNHYFHGNPLRSWFAPLNDVLREALRVDFWAGTACHLDLVQWATHPVQRDLGDRWPQLVAADREFLRWQIDVTSASTLVLNGAGVVRELERAGVISKPEITLVDFTKKNGHAWRLRVYRAEANGKPVIGWNHVIARAGDWPAGARERLLEELVRLVGDVALADATRAAGGASAPEPSGQAPQPAGWYVVARDHLGEVAFSGVVPREDRRQIKQWRDELLDVSVEPLASLSDPPSSGR